MAPRDHDEVDERAKDALELEGPLPGKMTMSDLRTIRTVLLMGGTLPDAGAMAGLTPSQFKGYLAKGQRLAEQGMAWRDIIDDGDTEPKAGYLHLYEVVVRSRVRGKLRLVRKIQGAVDRGNWKASAWLLERRFAKEYGRQDRLTVAKDTGDPLRQIMDMGSSERQARLLELRGSVVSEGTDETGPGVDPGAVPDLVPDPTDLLPMPDPPEDGFEGDE